jgi:hypothetical protein
MNLIHKIKKNLVAPKVKVVKMKVIAAIVMKAVIV